MEDIPDTMPSVFDILAGEAVSLSVKRGVFALLLSLIGAGCSSAKYATEGRIYAEELTRELVRLHACNSEQLCRSEKRVTWQASGWKLGSLEGGGVTVHVYDLPNTKIADALIGRCEALHASMPKVALTLAIHPNPYSPYTHPRAQIYTRLAHFQSSITTYDSMLANLQAALTPEKQKSQANLAVWHKR